MKEFFLYIIILPVVIIVLHSITQRLYQLSSSYCLRRSRINLTKQLSWNCIATFFLLITAATENEKVYR